MLLSYLAKNALIDKYNFLNIDRRTVDPYTQQIHIMLDRGTKALLPPNVTRVPTLILVNQKHQAIVGEDIYAYLEPTVSRGQKLAVGENGEPSGFILAPSSGGVNIVSETFTMYDAKPEELLAKGTGGMRQMHNYASATIEPAYITTPTEDSSSSSRAMTMPSTQRQSMPHNSMQTQNAMQTHNAMQTQNSMQAQNSMQMVDNGNPGALTSRALLPNHSSAAKYDTYSLPQDGGFFRAGQIVVPELQRPPAHRHEKISGDVTIESLQQKRNEELQYSMPPMAHQLNQAVIPEIVDVRPPSSGIRNSDFGSPNFQPMVGGGGYFSNMPPQQQPPQQQQQQQMNRYGGQQPSEGYQAYMPKLNPEDAREMLFGRRPEERGKSATLSAPYLVNI